MTVRDGRRVLHDFGRCRAASSHGGVVHGSLVTARSERGMARDRAARHRSRVPADARPVPMVACGLCGREQPEHVRGVPRRFCSHACRQRAYAARKAAA